MRRGREIRIVIGELRETRMPDYLDAPLWMLMIPDVAKHAQFWEDSSRRGELEKLVRGFIAADPAALSS